MRNLLPALAAFVIALGAAPAVAADSPDAVVKATVEEVLAVIRQNPDRATLRRVAEEKVLPRFDFEAMTRLAAGRSWRDATPEQQKRLEQAFRSLLVNTYTSALARAGGKARGLEVKPVQAAANDREVTVKTVVRDEKPIAIDYRMERTPQGWKVFDVMVENVSLVTTYRGSFAEEVKRGGIDGLIQALEDKNRQLARG